VAQAARWALFRTGPAVRRQRQWVFFCDFFSAGSGRSSSSIFLLLGEWVVFVCDLCGVRLTAEYKKTAGPCFYLVFGCFSAWGVKKNTPLQEPPKISKNLKKNTKNFQRPPKKRQRPPEAQVGRGLVFNRAPALLRHSACVFRV
jgi:hypothetical protein